MDPLIVLEAIALAGLREMLNPYAIACIGLGTAGVFVWGARR